MLVLRGVRFVFGLGRGMEGLGIGDADLMMMAGSFLGWQPVLLAFFVGVFPALLFGLVQLWSRGDQALPFGPSLALGVLITLLGWQSIGPRFAPVLFEGAILAFLAAAGRDPPGGELPVADRSGGRPEASCWGLVVMAKTIIVDYGMANLRSVQKAFEKFGHAAEITGDPNRIAEADKVVLPGVGAFRDAIARLHEAGLAPTFDGTHSRRQAVLRHLPRPATAVHARATRTACTRGSTCSPAKWCASRTCRV